MKRMLFTVAVTWALFLCTALCEAQVPYRETVPDIQYNVSGERRLSRLSNDDVLFTILAFEDENVSKETLPLWYTDEAIQPYFQNYNPDYGRTLMVVSSMKGDEMYLSFVGEIKHKYNLGILSEENFAPFRNEFSIIHMMGDK